MLAPSSKKCSTWYKTRISISSLAFYTMHIPAKCLGNVRKDSATVSHLFSSSPSTHCELLDGDLRQMQIVIVVMRGVLV